MLFFNSLLIILFLFSCLPDAIGKMYKWVDETGQTHWSDRLPPPGDTAENLKEYDSIENNSKTENPEEFKGPGSEYVTISNIKTKVVKKRKYRKASSSNSDGSGSSSSGGSTTKITYWVSVKADVTSIESYSGYVRIYLQAVDGENFGIKKVYLRGNIESGQTTVLSETMCISRKIYRTIRKWEIKRVYTSKKKRKLK